MKNARRHLIGFIDFFEDFGGWTEAGRRPASVRPKAGRRLVVKGPTFEHYRPSAELHKKLPDFSAPHFLEHAKGMRCLQITERVNSQVKELLPRFPQPKRLTETIRLAHPLPFSNARVCFALNRMENFGEPLGGRPKAGRWPAFGRPPTGCPPGWSGQFWAHFLAGHFFWVLRMLGEPRNIL